MASDDERLETLINQCKSNDVDIKVDALTKLKGAFETGIEISDQDGLLHVLKACLRTPNQHLTTATLNALPPLLPLLVPRSNGHVHSTNTPPRSPSSSTSSIRPSGALDAAALRQVLNAFLPPSGVIERLGDKEKAQLKARETLVILGGLAFRSGGGSSITTKSRDKGPETPLAMFERYLRESGLTSKVWKVREQSILVLVYIRRAHHQFPIRPYLSLLVDCLEDMDPHVRDCARQAVIELFTGPGVTDGARADLKKEMTKKGVRKTIVDGVLSKFLEGSVNSNTHNRDGSENGDTTQAKPKEYVPPSLLLQARQPSGGSQSAGLSRTVSQGSVKDVSRPSSRTAVNPAMTEPFVAPTPTNDSVDIQPVYIASARDLENEFSTMLKSFEASHLIYVIETFNKEGNVGVRGMLKGDVHLRYSETFMILLKDGFIQSSLKTLASLRTTVAVNTTLLYGELAAVLGHSLDPFCETILTHLLKMSSLTKKITAQQSQASVTAIILHTSAQPRVILPILWNVLQEKTVQSRTFGVGHIKQYIEVHGQRSKAMIEASTGLELLEKSLKKALNDPNPAVRENARLLFWSFEEIWPDHGMSILNSFDTNARKQVEKVSPRPAMVSSLAPTTPKVKKSLAATIAASRAKAKAIATAPPTLHHQATSGSHVPAVKRAASPASPRSSVARPSSPLRTSSSPPSSTSPGRLRTVSGTLSHSNNSTSVSSSHARSPSSGSNGSAAPASPPSPSDFRRRASSPLSTNTMNRPLTIRKPLHASPTPQRNATHTNNTLNRTPVVSIPPKRSLLSLRMAGDDESLLTAQVVPIPDSDSEDDHSINLLSFSTPFEVYPPITPQTGTANNNSASPGSVDSRPTVLSKAMSSSSVTDTVTDQNVIEDVLRARAEQAESAAERLLELVDPEEDGSHHSPLPPSLLVGSSSAHAASKSEPKDKSTPLPIGGVYKNPPATPINRNAAILKQAAMFQDSPVRSGQSASLVNVLQDRKHETGWWLKRKALVLQETSLREAQSTERATELQSYITDLAEGKLGVPGLQKLVLFSIENSLSDTSSPPPSPGRRGSDSPSPFAPSKSLPNLRVELWETDKNIERLFNALVQFLQPSKSEEELEYGLILLLELLENQGQYLEGRESDLFSVLLRVRYCNKVNILEATSTIRDAITTSIEPVYGITTMHASLRAFLLEPKPQTVEDDVKSASYAFGLIALGKFILRLPAEIAEEELPRLKLTLISSLNDKASLIVRESAAAAIIAAQVVLRDETHLFALLDGLGDEKKNLLAYLFDKHGVRGSTDSTSSSSSIMKLQKEITRLDTRICTPPKLSMRKE